MKNVDDIPLLLPLVHGVNIKLEKTGGIRPGLQAIMAARQAGLTVWVCNVARRSWSHS
jgi:L-alanine-DL-glutamate epimerase-like enolase superfamily enzyme